VVNDRLGRQPVKLGEFGMELADLVLTPGRRPELMMGDRRHHEEAGGGRVQAPVQPIGTLHARSLPHAPGTMWIASAD
jgi:hypothetical protein